MVDKISSWQFAENYIEEPLPIARARARADELGIESVTPSVGATLALLVNAIGAKPVVEVGTGTHYRSKSNRAKGCFDQVASWSSLMRFGVTVFQIS